MQIRPMRKDDVPQVHAIETQTQFQPWSERMFYDALDAGDYAIVAEHERRVVGFALLRIALEEADILNISVMPQQQRCGIGQALLDDVMQQARLRQVQRLLLEVRQSNHKACAFYHRLGFSRIGVRRNYYRSASGREDALLLARRL